MPATRVSFVITRVKRVRRDGERTVPRTSGPDVM